MAFMNEERHEDATDRARTTSDEDPHGTSLAPQHPTPLSADTGRFERWVSPDLARIESVSR